MCVFGKESVLPNCEDDACLKFMRIHQVGPYAGWICKGPRTEMQSKKSRKGKKAHDKADSKRKKKKRLIKDN